MTALPTLDDAQTLIPDVFETHATFRPRQEAVVCGAVRRDWGEFNARINRVAHGLLARGVSRGDRVAVLMGNSVEMLECLFGIVKAGACAVPLSGLLTGEQLAGLIADSGAVGLFATEEFRAKVDPLRATLAAVRPELTIAVHGSRDGWVDHAALVAGMPATMPPVVCALSDPFNIIYLSLIHI